jgi:membrane protein
LREAADNWTDHRAMRMAAAVAFYSILSLSSLSLCAIAVSGLIYGEAAASGALTNQLKLAFGDAGGEVARQALEHAERPGKGIAATILGACILLFAASNVFSEIQDDLNSIWNVKSKPGRALRMIVEDRLLSVAMVLVSGVLLVASLIVTTFLEAFGGFVGVAEESLYSRLSALGASFFVVFVLFAAMFKYLPDARIAWRDVWFGAFATACLFTLGKYGIAVYLANAGITTSFGAAGSVVLFALWIYYSALIFFFGAELTRAKVRRSGRTVVPSGNALIAEPEPLTAPPA